MPKTPMLKEKLDIEIGVLNIAKIMLGRFSKLVQLDTQRRSSKGFINMFTIAFLKMFS